MRIRFCPKCGKAGLRMEDSDGKGVDGLTASERYERRTTRDFNMRYCPRCREWVKPNIGANVDQHKRR